MSPPSLDVELEKQREKENTERQKSEYMLSTSLLVTLLAARSVTGSLFIKVSSNQAFVDSKMYNTVDSTSSVSLVSR